MCVFLVDGLSREYRSWVDRRMGGFGALSSTPTELPLYLPTSLPTGVPYKSGIV